MVCVYIENPIDPGWALADGGVRVEGRGGGGKGWLGGHTEGAQPVHPRPVSTRLPSHVLELKLGQWCVFSLWFCYGSTKSSIHIYLKM